MLMISSSSSFPPSSFHFLNRNSRMDRRTGALKSNDGTTGVTSGVQDSAKRDCFIHFVMGRIGEARSWSFHAAVFTTRLARLARALEVSLPRLENNCDSNMRSLSIGRCCRYVLHLLSTAGILRSAFPVGRHKDCR